MLPVITNLDALPFERPDLTRYCRRSGPVCPPGNTRQSSQMHLSALQQTQSRTLYDSRELIDAYAARIIRRTRPPFPWRLSGSRRSISQLGSLPAKYAPPHSRGVHNRPPNDTSFVARYCHAQLLRPCARHRRARGTPPVFLSPRPA